MMMEIVETFDNLWKVNMKLNPNKCSFGVNEGKFLGYKVTSEGIRANLKKTKVVADMQSPKTLKEVRNVKPVPLQICGTSPTILLDTKNITTENKDDYRWTEDVERAFQEMKKLIIELPSLTTLMPKETLFVYLATSKDTPPDSTQDEGASAEGKGRLKAGGMPIKR
ncbi:hypothetical protein Tco_1164633 [Tanacetum coccineum]